MPAMPRHKNSSQCTEVSFQNPGWGLVSVKVPWKMVPRDDLLQEPFSQLKTYSDEEQEEALSWKTKPLQSTGPRLQETAQQIMGGWKMQAKIVSTKICKRWVQVLGTLEAFAGNGKWEAFDNSDWLAYTTCGSAIRGARWNIGYASKEHH